MSTLTSNTIFTPEDLLRMPDHKDYELVDGQLLERHVSIESSRVGTRIAIALGIGAAKTGEATVFAVEMGYQCFPDDRMRIRKPDVSLIRRDRLSDVTEDAGYMPIPADLAVEVISPNDTWYEVSRKVEEYLAAGFKLVWVVDPATRVVTIHRADGTVAKLHESDEITGESALPAFRCRVGEFFQA